MKFVTVYRVMNEVEAAMVRDFLQEQGIGGKLSSDFPSAVYGLSTQEIEVQVGEADEARARELIEAYFSVDPVDAPDAEADAEDAG